MLFAVDWTPEAILAAIVAAMGGGEGLRRLLIWGRKVIKAGMEIADKAEAYAKMASDLKDLRETDKATAEQFDSVHGRVTYLEAHTEAAQIAAGLAKIAWDSQGNCVYVCLEWQSLTGLGIEDARGNGWLESIHPEDRPRVRILWDEFLKGARRRLSVEYRIQRPEGLIVYARLRAGRGYSANRESTAIVGYTYSVSEPPGPGAKT